MTDIAFTQSTFAEMYERWLVQPLFRPWVDDILDRVRFAPSDRVLDVACGTGIAARTAHARAGGGGRVVGVDVSPQMLAVARSIAPDIDWREGSAIELPIAADEKFDLVLCQQGLQFFPDTLAAAREMRRALDRAGRVAIATWRPLEEMPFLVTLHSIAERHLGPIVDRRHSFGEAAALETLLGEAGFRDIQVETVSRIVQFEEAAVFLRLNAMALVGMSAGGRTMSEEEKAGGAAAIAEESASEVPTSGRPGLAFAMATNVATARVP